MDTLWDKRLLYAWRKIGDLMKCCKCKENIDFELPYIKACEWQPLQFNKFVQRKDKIICPHCWEIMESSLAEYLREINELSD